MSYCGLSSPLGCISQNEMSTAKDFASLFDLRNRFVLEVGGALSPEVVAKLGVGMWVSVDPLNQPVETEGYVKIKGHADSTGLPGGCADFVFSCNAFEHVNSLDKTLAEIKRVSKPYASIYSHFGPIWSAPDGHHMDIVYDGVAYNFWERQIIPHWFHLLYDEDELQAMLSRCLDGELVRKATHHIYHHSWINRLHFEDYLSAFNGSGLTTEFLSTARQIDYEVKWPPNFAELGRFCSTEEILTALRKKFSTKYRDFFCRDIRVILRHFDF